MEKKFEKVLNELDQIFFKTENFKNATNSKESFIFSIKTEIYDFLFKIKGKEDKHEEQHRIINEILGLIEESKSKINDEILLFRYKSRYFLK